MSKTVVGLKPTFGRVSKAGVLPLSWRFDQAGPLARTVEDAALCLDVIAGHDPADSTSAPRPAPGLTGALGGGIAGMRIGVPRHLLDRGVEPGVLSAFEEGLRTLGELGATVREIDLPHSRFAIPVYYLVATAEASSNLARYDGVRYGRRMAAASLDEMYGRTRSAGFGAEVKRRIMLGTWVLSAGYYDAYYLKAQQVRTLIGSDFERAFAAVDAVALPTSPTPAFPLGERVADPLRMYLADVFTVSASLAGLPALSVPCGFADGPLPVGLQLVGRAWDEATLLRIAHTYEAATPWADRRPPGCH